LSPSSGPPCTEKSHLKWSFHVPFYFCPRTLPNLPGGWDLFGCKVSSVQNQCKESQHPRAGGGSQWRCCCCQWFRQRCWGYPQGSIAQKQPRNNSCTGFSPLPVLPPCSLISASYLSPTQPVSTVVQIVFFGTPGCLRICLILLPLPLDFVVLFCLREGGFILAHGFRGVSPLWQGEHGRADQLTAWWPGRREGECLNLLFG
jgi:hypothetical protein